MPSEWEKFKANRIKDTDSDEEIEKKQFNMTICAEKYPYFFQYRYLSMKRDYDAYKSTANTIAITNFNKTIEEMRNCPDLTEEERIFMEKYKKNCPMDESHGVQNKICWAIEREFDNFKAIKPVGISCLSVLNYQNINENLKKEVEFLCKEYKNEIKKQSKQYIKYNLNDNDVSKSSTEILNCFVAEMYKICSNESELCDILIDLCYNSGYNKEIVWSACGDVIATRLLDSSSNTIRYPKCVDEEDIEPHFICVGKKYVMNEIQKGEII